VSVKGEQKTRLIARHIRLQPPEHGFGYKERPFHRTVMAPEPDRSSRLIEASALVREIQHRPPCFFGRRRELSRRWPPLAVALPELLQSEFAGLTGSLPRIKLSARFILSSVCYEVPSRNNLAPGSDASPRHLTASRWEPPSAEARLAALPTTPLEFTAAIPKIGLRQGDLPSLTREHIVCLSHRRLGGDAAGDDQSMRFKRRKSESLHLTTGCDILDDRSLKRARCCRERHLAFVSEHFAPLGI
jgi:hypothetical protein